MPSLVPEAAQAVANALASQPTPPGVRWRWGDVTAVNADGTMDVEVAGAELVGIRAASHVMGARAGDRVRVSHLGTETMVDAIVGTGTGTQVVTTASEIVTAASGYTVSDAKLARSGKVAMLDLTLGHTAQLSANTQYKVATLVAGCRPAVAAYGGFIMDRNTYGNVVVSTDGSVYVRLTATAAASVALRFGATFLLA